MPKLKFKLGTGEFFTKDSEYEIVEGDYEIAVNSNPDGNYSRIGEEVVVIDDNGADHYLDGKFLKESFDYIEG